MYYLYTFIIYKKYYYIYRECNENNRNEPKIKINK